MEQGSSALHEHPVPSFCVTILLRGIWGCQVPFNAVFRKEHREGFSHIFAASVRVKDLDADSSLIDNPGVKQLEGFGELMFLLQEVY